MYNTYDTTAGVQFAIEFGKIYKRAMRKYLESAMKNKTCAISLHGSKYDFSQVRLG